jgi:hypothetical protein
VVVVVVVVGIGRFVKEEVRIPTLYGIVLRVDRSKKRRIKVVWEEVEEKARLAHADDDEE